MKRKIFRWGTLILFVLSVWTAYANVLSDDAEVRTKARAAIVKASGCGENCTLQGLRGDRGMFEETIELDVVKHGHFVAVCRRAYISFGEHTCTVQPR
jgi:hypothetical protein